MKTVILGGGLSGLSAAWFLLKKDPLAKITLLEKEARVGGWVETKREKGFHYERGPRTLSKARSPALLELIHELGLTSEIIPSLPAANHRFLWTQGKLRSVGSFWPTLLSGALRDLITRRKKSEDESIYDFASRRFGSYLAETFFDPMSLGIYAGDIRKLSIRSCFPALWQWEQTEGSVLRGLWKKKKGERGLFTLRGGLERIIDELKKQLPIKIVRHCTVDSITPEIQTSKGLFSADQIISALPAYEISRLTHTPLNIPYRSIWVVHIGFNSPVLKRKGFGYLVPSKEKQNLLGMVWDSEIFAEEPQTRLTAMLREESKDPVADARSALASHLNIHEEPTLISSSLARFAIPQFEVGHHEEIAHFETKIKAQYPFLKLTGNYFSGASLEACIQRSKTI